MARRNFDYDLVIIGGGSAGIVSGNVAGALGARVALVEKSRIGGECLWTGCVPSKALLHVADVAHTLRRGRSLGLKNVRLSRDDCAGAFRYVREKIDEVRGNDATEQMLRDFGVELFFGEGSFVSPHLFSTPQGDLRGANFLLATGSAPRVPEIPGLAEAGYLTNQTLFDLEAVPASLIIIGGGYIACEMGQALNRLGCSVTIVERGERLLKKDDPELVGMLTDVLQNEGVKVVLNAEVIRVRRDLEGHRVVTFRNGDQESDLAAEAVLVTTGRQANTNGLSLGAVGARLDEKGNVGVDAMGRTSTPHIWACGDVTGQFQFSHMAEHEAKAVVRNILFPVPQKISFDLVPWATFTDPELATVGLTEDAAREKYGADSVQVVRHEFRQDDRAIVEGSTVGQVKVIVAGTNGAVVGAQILGPRAGELIHEWVIAIAHKLPVRAIADLVHVYPTLSVSNQRAAQRWYAGVMQKPLVQRGLTLLGYQPRDAGSL